MSTLWKIWLLLVLLGGGVGFWVRTERATPDRVTLSSTYAPRLAEVTGDPAHRHSTPRLQATHLVTPVPNVRSEFASSSSADAFHFERDVISAVSSDWTPAQVVVGDVTGDRLNDVILRLNYAGAAGNGPILVRIHEQNPDGSLAEPIEVEVRSNGLDGLELVDLDGDRVSEIAVGGEDGLTIIARREGRFSQASYPGQVSASYLAAIDADADGHLDVFAQGWSEGADIYFGDGYGGIRTVSHEATSPIGYNTVEVNDFTADGLDDLIMTNGQGWPLVWVYPYQSGLGLQAPIEMDLRPAQTDPASGMTVADMNRDGRPDLIVSNEGLRNTPEGIRIFYRGIGSDFTHSVLLETEGDDQRPGVVAVADVDGNGYPDVVTMFNSYDQMGYFLQGPSGFAPLAVQPTDDNPWTNNHYRDNSIAIGDVNLDGCLDVSLAEVSSSLRIFYGRNCQAASIRTSGDCLIQVPVGR